jgi:hypothetical protein
VNQTQVRRDLFLGSISIIAAVLGFLWILNINQAPELKRTFLVYIVVLWVFSAAAFAVFYFKGILFKSTGGLDQNIIIMITVIMLLIVQITLTFAVYAYREMQFSFRSYDKALELFQSADWTSTEQVLEKTADGLPDGIDRLYILDAQGRLEYALPPLPAGGGAEYHPAGRYLFPLSNGAFLGMHISREYHRAQVRRTLLDLFTVMVVSLFFGFELVLFLIHLLEVRMLCQTGAIFPTKNGRRPAAHGINFIRQMAFLFYFASRL